MITHEVTNPLGDMVNRTVSLSVRGVYLYAKQCVRNEPAVLASPNTSSAACSTKFGVSSTSPPTCAKARSAAAALATPAEALHIECAVPAPARVRVWRCEGLPGPCPTRCVCVCVETLLQGDRETGRASVSWGSECGRAESGGVSTVWRRSPAAASAGQCALAMRPRAAAA